jgi:hypothetical protein
VYEAGWERDKFRLPGGWERGVRRHSGRKGVLAYCDSKGRNGVNFGR